MSVSPLPPTRAFEAPLGDPFVVAAVDWARGLLTSEDAGGARARLDALMPGSALAHMSRCFGLSPVEEDLLILALVHRVDGGFAALCAEAVGDPRQSYVTAHLLARVIGGGNAGFTAALFGHLVPHAPLRRWSLVEMRETHTLAAITLSEGVALRLVGTCARAWPPGAAPLEAPPPVPRLEVLTARLAARAGQTGIALIGAAGSGRRAVASGIATTAGRLAIKVDPAKAAEDADLAALARDAWLDGLLIVAEVDPDQHGQMPASDEATTEARIGAHARSWAERASQVLAGHLVLVARDGTGLPVGVHRERLDPLGAEDRRVIWRDALPDLPARERDEVARHFPFGPTDIAAIAASTMEGDPPGTVWRLCRERGGQGLEALASRIAPRFGWDDLILPDNVTRELRAIADQMRHRARVYDDWAFAKRLSSGRGVTALFAGPSGTGKTMAAEVIAGELGLDLYKVDLSRLVSKYIGETEKNLRRVFDAAEETGACLFMDEADACLGKRSEVKDSHDRHANIEVSYLLQRMESYSGLCLLATNLKNNLDAAFLRRLRFVVDIPFPSQGDRHRIWGGAFPPDTPTEGLDLVALSRLDISGGSIVVIAINAAFLAAARDEPVRMDHIAQAARGEYRKHDRTFRAAWAGGGT